MYIEDVYNRLLESARMRVRSGEVTERGLARLCDMSQPHMHNVLKNIRMLSPGSADRLMRALRLTIPELLWHYPGENQAGIRAVPALRARIGPGFEPSFSDFRGYIPFPVSLVEGLVQPVAARLAQDLHLPAALSANDLVLLDQNPAVRARPGGRGTWVVMEKGGPRVRYVRVGGTHVYLPGEHVVHDPQKWQPVSVQGRNILEVVRARVVWIGREMEKEPYGPADEARPGD